MRFLLVLCMFLATGSVVFAADNSEEYRRIIEQRCSQCHTTERIEQALAHGENLNEIITKMIRMGAQLDSREKEVLGVFWAEKQREIEVLKAQNPTLASDPLGEYRAIVEQRCTGCHSLDVVEKAMMEGRSLDELLTMMAARGVIVSEAEKSVLGTFWGTPFKPELPE